MLAAAAAAAAVGLTMAAALPASASAPNSYSILGRAGASAPVYCLQPADCRVRDLMPRLAGETPA
jgi:hypothetical protein